MVAEPWIQKMRKKKAGKIPPRNPGSGAGPATIGILSFELANAMSRAVHLHRSLSDAGISRLLTETLASPAIRSLVSGDGSFLLSLAVFEKLDDLNRVADVAARLGRRNCSHPALVGFEHVYSDLLAGRIQNSASFVYTARDMDAAARKMERYVSSTAALYAELGVLSDLEHSAKKFPDTDETRRAFDQKIRWQRHDVKQIRDSSLWNQSFDKALLLLARAVCTVHARIRSVFGEYVLGEEAANSPAFSGRIVKSGQITRPGLVPSLRLLHCGAYPGRLFLNCLNFGGNEDQNIETESSVVSFPGDKSRLSKSGFGPKSRLTMMAPPSTVGGSCLALHYANVVIIIEKMLRYPQLVGEEARDDLYQMLPGSLRKALRRSLRSYVKSTAIYDASLAHEWKGAMERIMGWMGPMAHGMIRWQTERNYEQQQIVMGEGVLLLETLYFADRGKAEEAICELLVGLNYICRYEQQQNALLDCTSSVDFDDCMDWQQMQRDSAESL